MNILAIIIQVYIGVIWDDYKHSLPTLPSAAVERKVCLAWSSGFSVFVEDLCSFFFSGIRVQACLESLNPEPSTLNPKGRVPGPAIRAKSLV